MLKIFRAVTAVSLSLLMVLSPLQAAKVRIGFINDWRLFGDGCVRDGDEDLLNDYERVFKNDEEKFRGFIEAAHTYGITKLLELPKPSQGCLPDGSSASDYIDLKAGTYKSVSFHRYARPNAFLYTPVFFYGHRYDVYYFEVEESEADEICPDLLCRCRLAAASEHNQPVHGNNDQNELEPPPAEIEVNGLSQSEGIVTHKNLILGVIGVLITGGIGLCIRHYKKIEEEKKKKNRIEKNKKKFVNGITRRNLGSNSK
ncbi:MAG: hypothetical protein LBL71_00560, partial [Endomicrobium sp.]|nr:hypothetical protein [Endomicrobium sp.]